jgi:transposase
VDTSPAPPRRQYSDRYRRQVVAETWRGGESVSEVARRHDLNTNLVFKWRQRYPKLTSSADASSSLIPIHLTPTPVGTDAILPADGSLGQIAITLRGGHQLSLKGAVDPTLARAVLESLR